MEFPIPEITRHLGVPFILTSSLLFKVLDGKAGREFYRMYTFPVLKQDVATYEWSGAISIPLSVAL